MDFKANCGVWGTMFGVPYIVADNFLKLATGEQIKVLLYVLRCSGRNASAEEISMNTGVPVSQIDDALLFWQQANVLIPEQQPVTTERTPVALPVASAPKPAAAENLSQTDSVPSVQHHKQNYAPSEISELLKVSPDISDLFKIAESSLGSLNYTMQNSLIWMYNYLGLKKEVIITLLIYCISIEKTNPRYIETIAESWAEKDINTLEIAQEEVEALSVKHSFTGKIMKLFEMKRKPTTKQLEIIEQWRSAGYDPELIHYAYEKNIENLDKLSFDYINKILLSWKENGYTTIRDVNKAEDDYKRNKSAKTKNGANDFDVDKYKIGINNI